MTTNSMAEQLNAAQDTLLAIAATKVDPKTAAEDLKTIKEEAKKALIASGYDPDMLQVLFGDG